MSGIDLLKRVRVEYPETAIILMTAFATVQTAIEAMKAGAYDYITKPIHPFELKELVKRSIEHRRLIDESSGSAEFPGSQVRIRGDHRLLSGSLTKLGRRGPDGGHRRDRSNLR